MNEPGHGAAAAAVPVLEVRGLVRRFGGVAALDGADFSVSSGSITGLIGPNGAGKTTLFNVVSGFLRPEQGFVRFGGREITGEAPHRVAGCGLVRTFQTARVLTRMSVLENMMLAAPAQPGEHLTWLVLAPSRARRRERDVRERARELLALVRLDRHSADYAGTLSGGQRKLLEFARALMAEPRMVLLDEPMAGVNPALAEQLLDHVLDLRAERGLTFLVIEHDLEMVMSVCDRVVVMSEGRVIAAGAPEAVRRDTRVADAYLGSRLAGEPSREPLG